MLTHRGFSAWIESNGETLPEYLVAVDENTHKVSCWIPGNEGQTFAVYWSDAGGAVPTCAFITLDGIIAPGRFLSGNGVNSRSGLRVSKNSERPFMFKAIDETATGPSNAVNNKDLGLITLKIKRVRLLDGRPANPIQAAPSPVLGKRKAGDLCIDFGEEETQPFEQSAVTWAVSSYEDDTPGAKPSTYVSFAFRYRSPDFLEAQGIIPEGELTTIAPTKKEPATPEIPFVMPATIPMPPPLALPVPAPKMPPPRRMASLPAPPVRLESEEPPPPATRPAKKPRLSSDALGNPPVRTLRRPSHELRRAASTPAKTVSTSTLPADTTPYQGTFFVTRPSSAYHYLSVPPSSSDTSPDTTVNDDSSFYE